MNGSELFAEGERLLAQSHAAPSGSEAMLLAVQAQAYFAAAQVTAALKDNLARALLPLDAAVTWQRSQDPPAPTPDNADAQARRDLTAQLGQHRGHRVELHGAGGAVLARGILHKLDAHGAHFRPALLEAGNPTVPLAEITGAALLQDRTDQPGPRALVVMPRDRAVSLIGPLGWSLHGWTVASNIRVHSDRDTASHKLVITDGAGRYYMAEYERPHDRSREPWEGDTEVVFEAAEQITRLVVVTDHRLIHPDNFAVTAQSEATDG